MKRSILTLSLLSVFAVSSCQKDFDEVTPRGDDQHAEVNGVTPAAPSLLSTEGAEAGVLYMRIQKSAKPSLRAFDSGAASMQALPSQLARSLQSIGSETMEPLFPIDPRFEKRMRREGLDLWYIVRFDKKQDLRSAMQTLLATPEVEYTEPVYQLALPETKPVAVSDARRTDEPAAPFNDPLLPDQWHYNNTGKFARSIAGADIGLFEAWKTETGKRNVIVAITDGGIDTKHPDLKDNLYTNEKELNGQEGVDDDGNGLIDDVYGFNFIHSNGKIYPDDVSHGTHVAGTVAARNNNGIGVGGIAGGDGTPGSGIRLMSAQIFGGKNENGNSTRALIYSANNGAVISQNSWGYRYEAQITTLPQSLKAAIDYFIKYAGCDNDGNQLPNSPMKGGVVIFAAGNDGREYNSLPAAYEPVVAVASMACPHVSGVAALIVSHFGKKGFTNTECKQRLLGALKPQNIDALTGFKGRMGRGYIDASAIFAVNKGKAPNRIAKISADDVDFVTANVSWIAVADEDDGTPVEYRVYLSEQSITDANKADALYTTLNARGYSVGSKIFLPLAALKENTTYHVAVEAIDRWDQSSGLTKGDFKTKKNNPPVLTLSTKDKIRVSSLSKQTFSVTFSDPDNQKVSIVVGGETRGVSHQISGDKILFTLRAVAPVGHHEIKVTAIDVLGAKTELSIPFEVYTYKAPSFIASLGSHVVGVGKTASVEVAPALEKSEGVTLSYKASVADGSIASATISAEGVLSIQGHKTGTTQVQVEVSDGISTPVQTSVPVRVVTKPSDLVYSVYPIPATTELNIVLNPEIASANVQIRSLTGAKVYDRDHTVKGVGRIKLQVKNLAPGTYSLSIKSPRGTYTKAFVKN